MIKTRGKKKMEGSEEEGREGRPKMEKAREMGRNESRV